MNSASWPFPHVAIRPSGPEDEREPPRPNPAPPRYDLFGLLANAHHRAALRLLAVRDMSLRDLVKLLDDQVYPLSRTARQHQLRTLRLRGLAWSDPDGRNTSSHAYRLTPKGHRLVEALESILKLEEL